MFYEVRLAWGIVIFAASYVTTGCLISFIISYWLPNRKKLKKSPECYFCKRKATKQLKATHNLYGKWTNETIGYCTQHYNKYIKRYIEC